MLSLFFVILAALALGVLIFIHELGHYWVARRVGIKVEAFSIGFGRPLVKWVRDGVEWRIGWLPLGGYVRMAGESKSGDKQPHEVEGGFFAARPIDRIKVALAGPVVNLAFAFLIFLAIWLSGGREKPFRDFTDRVGWVDQNSELYTAGIRPGDIIKSYDEHIAKSWHDHLSAPLLAEDTVHVKGSKVNYFKGTKAPFDLSVGVYPHPQAADDSLLTVGFLYPAEYLLLEPPSKHQPLVIEGSPLERSGLARGDRLLWFDGQLLFSQEQLSRILNQQDSLLTVLRGDEALLRRVPRLPLGELALPDAVRFELGDWHYESGLSERFLQTQFIPYDIAANGIVEGRLAAIDEEEQAKLFPDHPFSNVEEPLLVGDQILAVDGVPVSHGTQLLELLQKHRVHLIVQHRPVDVAPVSSTEANALFDERLNWSDAQKITSTIGLNNPVEEAGDLVLLKPFVPVTLGQLAEGSGPSSLYGASVAARRQEIATIANPEQRAQATRELEHQLNILVLGVTLRDSEVRYNPPPTTVFWKVIVDTWRTLKALVTGSLSPKWLSGPVGIVQVIQHGWSVGVKEALFWVGVISLNLGILNLLPIPVLDGGNICFSLWELITRRRIRPEVMEKLIIPFVVLIIGFFLFVTYHDLSRLFRGLF